MKRLFWYFTKAYKKFMADRCPLLASALVHATTFSLFPLILGLLSLSLYLLGSSEAVIEKILPILKQILPFGIDQIVRNISTIRQTSIVVGLFGMLGFLWGTASIFRALESTLNVIWKVKQDRPFFKKSLLTISSAFLVFMLLMVSVGLTFWAQTIGVHGIFNTLSKFNVVFSILLYGIIYWLFPNRKVPLKAAYIGAAFTGILWELAKHMFSFYVTKIVDYSKVFGSLSALIMLFIWFYYSAYIFLYGAQLSYVYARRKRLK